MIPNPVCVTYKCDRPVWSRGLCNSCYSSAVRSQTLNEYPTQKFIDDPASHIRWAFEHYPELVGDIAIEYGLSLSE